MSAVIVDRRKNDKGKSITNRRKFIDRVKGAVKDGLRDLIREGNIKDLVNSKGKKIKIPVRDLDQPNFHHDGSGINDIVVPGNDHYVVGDKIKRPPNQSGGGAGKQASKDGEGSDSFTFHLTKEEFEELLFDQCQLPNFIKESLAIVEDETITRSGYSPDGSPAQLNVNRSMRNAKSRRSGLKALKSKKIKKLEETIAALIEEIEKNNANHIDVSEQEQELNKLQEQLAVLKVKLAKVPFIDPVDLRFNNYTKTITPKAQAVIICLMDVSGSMDERKKELAKTFYLLLYMFLMRHHTSVEIVYITYHTKAQVVDENSFYYGLETGGTVTSEGTTLSYDTIMSTYPPALWNIYLAHCSDGDNFSHDNATVTDTVVNQLLPILQYYAYVQICPEQPKYMSFGDPSPTLWDIFAPLAETHSNVSVAKITHESNVYPVFVKLFERKK